MARALISEWLCEPCKEEGKEIPARTQCYECHELLCEPCSDYHLRLKRSKEHHLIELVQFRKKSIPRHDLPSSKQTSASINEDELASDFLEHVTLTEDTVLYLGAQVALQSTASKSKKSTTSEQIDPEQEKGTPSETSKPTTSRQTDPRRLKATKCLQYSVKRPGDKEKVNVWGVLSLSHNVVIVDNYNDVLKLFDQSGTYLSSAALKDYTQGITCVGDSTFVTCGRSNTVDLWSVHGNTVVSEDVYHVDEAADGIHYNGTYYCVVHRQNSTITVLNRQWRHVRKIKMLKAFGNEFEFGCDIYMDSDTHNIYVPCWRDHGVLCMTIEGEALWFTPLSLPPGGIIEIRGTLCVAGGDNCLHMITKEGEYVRKLLDQEDLGGKPECVCYGQNGKLYVSHSILSEKCDKIYVYTVT